MKTRFTPYEDESHSLEKEHSGHSVDESQSSVWTTVRLQCARSQNLGVDRSQASVCSRVRFSMDQNQARGRTTVRPQCGQESGVSVDQQALVWNSQTSL